MTRPTIHPLETHREGARHRVALSPVPEAFPTVDASRLRPRSAPLDAPTREALSRLHETYALASLGAAAGVSEPTVRRALAGATLSPHVRRALGALVETAAKAA